MSGNQHLYWVACSVCCSRFNQLQPAQGQVQPNRTNCRTRSYSVHFSSQEIWIIAVYNFFFGFLSSKIDLKRYPALFVKSGTLSLQQNQFSIASCGCMLCDVCVGELKDECPGCKKSSVKFLPVSVSLPPHLKEMFNRKLQSLNFSSFLNIQALGTNSLQLLFWYSVVPCYNIIKLSKPYKGRRFSIFRVY